MSKTVNVRVAKSKLLAALNEALDRTVKEKADGIKAEKDYKKSVEDFKKRLPALVKSGKLKINDYSYSEWRGEQTISVTFDAKSVEFPKKADNDYHEYSNNQAQEELRNAIRVLELSDEEYVRTSSYGAVAKYL